MKASGLGETLISAQQDRQAGTRAWRLYQPCLPTTTSVTALNLLKAEDSATYQGRHNLVGDQLPEASVLEICCHSREQGSRSKSGCREGSVQVTGNILLHQTSSDITRMCL